MSGYIKLISLNNKRLVTPKKRNVAKDNKMVESVERINGGNSSESPVCVFGTKREMIGMKRSAISKKKVRGNVEQNVHPEEPK